jgi:aspartyl-tRNA synthetase
MVNAFNTAPRLLVAAGVDRLIVMLLARDNLRDCHRVPMNQRAEDRMIPVSRPAVQKSGTDARIAVCGRLADITDV